MNLLELEEYTAYYHTYKRFPDGQYSNPDKVLNEQQILTKYKKYVSRTEKKATKTNSEYVSNVFTAEEEARNLDKDCDVFWNSLSIEQYDIIKKEMRKIKDFSIIDPCHIFSRGSSPQLADCVDNILMAPRAFHTFIDQYLNPFTEKHEALTREQHDDIWISIIGIDRWNKLLQMKRNNKFEVEGEIDE